MGIRKINWKKVLRWFRNIILALFLLSILMVVVYRFVPVYVTPLMLIRTVEQWQKGDKIKMAHQWVPLEEISPNMVQAVVASEDNLFMDHHGFDFQQIKVAVDEGKEGKRHRGASTITQQTAKNVFLFPTRSYFRKGLEAYFTVLIEWIWGKERIMEVYLNSIEMGEGIYGAEMAARMKFNKPAKQLSAREAALITACLPNPRRFNAAKPSPYILKREAQIRDLMGKIGRVELKEKKPEK